MLYKAVKVVELDAGDTRVSSCISNGAMVMYHPDRWTEPATGCGPLCVFNDLRDAFAFIGNANDYEIWECEIIPAEGSEIWTLNRRSVVYASDRVSLAWKVKIIRRIFRR